MIRLEGLSKYYKTTLSVGVGIRRVSLEFHLGEFVVITGESGSGKSTLLNIISGLDDYEEGEMYLFGEETSHYSGSDWESYRAAHIGFISQSYNIIESYTVYQNIILALELQGYQQEQQKARTLELIEQVGLSHRTHHKASKLSGGEKQRCAIARAIAKDCPVIVADEPTGNLDSKAGKAIMQLLHAISKDKLVVLVTHTFQHVEQYATRHIRMRDGEITEDRQLLETKLIEERPIFQDKRPIPFRTLLNASIRNLFAAPKRFIFQLLLQILIISIFIFIYAFLMYSEDIIVGEAVAERDSSHQLRLVRRDQDVIDTSLFANHNLIRSIGIYETAYETYVAVGFPGTTARLENFPIGEIKMDNASVINLSDITSGTLPGPNEVVVSDLVMETYDLKIGDELLFFGKYYQYIRSPGTLYTISGSTIRGNTKSVYFHADVFLSKEIALEGLLEVANRNAYYYYYNQEGRLTRSPFSSIKILFDDTMRAGTVHIPSHILPDPMEVQIVDYEFYFGPYFGHVEMFQVEIVDVVRTDATNTVIYMSTSFQEALIDVFFGDDYAPRSLVLNVHDLTDGKRLSDMIDHDDFRVFYHIVSATSRERILTQSEFESLAYFIVGSIGFALYTVVGVVIKNISLARKKDFAIIRSIGATRQYLSKQVILEQVISGMIAYFITVGILNITALYSYTMRQSMRHLFFHQYTILFVVSILLSIQVARMYNRKYFKFSVISALNHDPEERA